MIASVEHPVLTCSPYQAYVYAYPHKTAYRPLAPRALSDAWAGESRSDLFLYIHVPFCTMRCGFCNLFTTPNPKRELVTFYLDALRRQAEVTREAIPDAHFTRFAIGGGTPTYLDERELHDVFDIAERVMGAELQSIPVGVEVSPETTTAAKVEMLHARGVDRISIGIQSFIDSEVVDVGRPQSRAEVETALGLLVNRNFPTLNIDLIYGLPDQTVETWLYSLREALRYGPEELYLYPLYVRPLTGLGRSRTEWDDVRVTCYREARDQLLASGYEQVSMRMFRRADPKDVLLEQSRLPQYCCQDDGMVGLGCGARSYTRDLHYSLDYAVHPKSIKEIIGDYLARTRVDLSHAEFGFVLDDSEQRRRYLLQSILNVEGLDCTRYQMRFGVDPVSDFPDLRVFEEMELLSFDGRHWAPTPRGLERSDAIGPWFFSDRVRRLMEGYQQK